MNVLRAIVVIIGTLSLQASPYDVVIIGSGPAGLTAGAYTSRAQLKTLIIEGSIPGGQLSKAGLVENWPGETSILGINLITKMTENAKRYGCNFLDDTVRLCNVLEHPFIVTTGSGKKVKARSIIIATGSSLRKLNCPGEAEYLGKGVAACATCDAPFYKDQEIIVVGTGNPAVAEVEHLMHYAKKITVIETGDCITAKDKIRAKIFEHPKVSLLFNSVVKEIRGDGTKVTDVIIEHKKHHTIKKMPTDGVFIAIGFTPNTELFRDILELLPSGHIALKHHTSTSINGIFAAGNVADPLYQQVITAAGTGCMAALDAQRFLTGNELSFADIARFWRHLDT